MNESPEGFRHWFSDIIILLTILHLIEHKVCLVLLKTILSFLEAQFYFHFPSHRNTGLKTVIDNQPIKILISSSGQWVKRLSWTQKAAVWRLNFPGSLTYIDLLTIFSFSPKTVSQQFKTSSFANMLQPVLWAESGCCLLWLMPFEQNGCFGVSWNVHSAFGTVQMKMLPRLPPTAQK